LPASPPYAFTKNTGLKAPSHPWHHIPITNMRYRDCIFFEVKERNQKKVIMLPAVSTTKLL
jgi:hypothetical protein